MKKVGLLIICCFLLVQSFAQLSEDLGRLKEIELSKPHIKESYVNQANSNTFYLIGKQLFGFYKAFVSSQDANKCPFAPSCSVYMLRSIEKKGFVSGFFDGIDRLMRCNGRDLDKYHLDLHSKHLIDPPVKPENQ